jgi:hypothetical protein
VIGSTLGPELERDWNVAVGVTELTLTDGRRPVDAYTKPHARRRAGVGARARSLRLRQRLTRTVVGLVGTLVGRHTGRAARDAGPAAEPPREMLCCCAAGTGAG